MNIKFLLCWIGLLVCSFKIYAQVITTYAGIGPQGPIGSHSGDGGGAVLAGINRPSQMAFDSSGNLFFADAGNYRIRKINSSGIITTIAGNGTTAHSGDGGIATSAGLKPIAVTVDLSGNVYVADRNYRIRKISPSGIISTIAGIGTSGDSGDGGAATAAQLSSLDIAVDQIGNLYLLNGNKIRKVDTSGIISTIAGTTSAGYSGDSGPASAAVFNLLHGIVLDHMGNMYVADMNNYRIRRINSAGVITTYAGNGTNNHSGDDGPATAASIGQVYGLGTDNMGNLYISEYGNHYIRKVSTSGIITTIAGTGIQDFSGDGGPATAAQIHSPCGVVVDKYGSIYIADNFNNRIRKISSTVSTGNAKSGEQTLSICPNPVSGELIIQCDNLAYKSFVITNAIGQQLITQPITSPQTKVDVKMLSAGLYYITFTGDNGTVVRKFVKQ